MNNIADPSESAVREPTIPRDPLPPERTQARGALIALGVAAVGTVAFVVGLRSALRRMPPEPTPASMTADSVRRDSVRRSRFAPPPANTPDEYPRLR